MSHTRTHTPARTPPPHTHTASPYTVKSGIEAMKYLPYVSVKLAPRISEFLKTGKIKEFEGVFKSERYRVLDAFVHIPWVGVCKELGVAFRMLFFIVGSPKRAPIDR